MNSGLTLVIQLTALSTPIFAARFGAFEMHGSDIWPIEQEGSKFETDHRRPFEPSA